MKRSRWNYTLQYRNNRRWQLTEFHLKWEIGEQHVAVRLRDDHRSYFKVIERQEA